MANNQEILAHFIEKEEEAAAAFATAQNNIRTLRDFITNTDSFTSSANTTKKNAIKHSGCSTCNSWS